MNPKCACPYCDTHIEFESDQADQAVACPHCGKDVVLTTASTAQQIRTEPQLTVREALLDRTQYSNERTIVNWSCGLTTVAAGIGLVMLIVGGGGGEYGAVAFISIIACLLAAWVSWGLAHAIFDMADCALRRFDVEDDDEPGNENSN